ncbi:MAG: M1 family metallopeptidase [Reichenbachiella sp.]|uniref:M1 family metallopeptidase n=1 Tax=Reichenbachiella sp. TaxID=2184521 RepID=UPI0032669CDB
MHLRRIGHILSILLFLISSLSFGQRRQVEPFDVLHYQFKVVLNDTTDYVKVDAQIAIRYLNEIPVHTTLDLAVQSRSGFGMKVDYLSLNDLETDFTHRSDELSILTPGGIQIKDTVLLNISYSGRPDNGLVISKNANGDRTFFAEHWPNRAHRWLPVIDHPAEKATCEFHVIAPERYDVVSNGDKREEKLISNGLKRTVWKMNNPIPSKIMVIGVAEFNTQKLGGNDRMTAWVYDKPGSQALNDFVDVPQIFDILDDLLGEYPFSKCDQVESTTKFGGMENAGNIFYPERLLNGNKDMNHTIAHEIGHQWFGNSVSEADWTDVWISEGFATYLEYYYVLNYEGKEAFLKKLKVDEQKVLNYQFRFPGQTVVQTNIKRLEGILNPMVYEKAAWVLRMLSEKIGEDTFNKIMLTFYERHKFGNASTQDFIGIANELSPEELSSFFEQWFYTPGTPSVDYYWKYKNGKLLIDFRQKTTYTYQFDVDIKLKYDDERIDIKRVTVSEKNQRVELSCEKPNRLIVDPMNVILGEFSEW